MTELKPAHPSAMNLSPKRMPVVFIRPILVAAVTSVVLLLGCSPSDKAPTLSTQMGLEDVGFTLRLLEATNHATVAEQLRGVSGGATLQEKWERLLLDNAARLDTKPDHIREFLCRDGWGRRFNVEFKTNLVARGASAALLNTSFDLVVWSSGRNGTNEFGNGDDVLIPPPAPNN